MPRYANLAEGTVAGFFFPAAVVAGYLLGKWIGARLGSASVGSYAGATVGVAAAFWNLFGFLRRMERRDRSE